MQFLIQLYLNVSEDLVQYVQRLESRVKLLEEEKQALQQKLGQTPWETPPPDNVCKTRVLHVVILNCVEKMKIWLDVN